MIHKNTSQIKPSDKILLVNKPLNCTSHDVVKTIRSLIIKQYTLSKIKVGHCGTLDPLADGLLILLIGNKTKQSIKFLNLNKVYTGIIKLGYQTNTYDRESEEQFISDINHILPDDIYKVCNTFKGDQKQIPPMFSAIKYKGQPLYKLARKNQHIDLPARNIHIYDFIITKIDMPFIHFKVECSKGTYIRSLAKEVGDKLNCGGYLYQLTRTSIGEYNVKDSYTIEDIKSTLPFYDK